MTEPSFSFRRELLCVARNCSSRQHEYDVAEGRLSPADAVQRDPEKGKKHIRAWSLELLQRHDPKLARRCLALSAIATLTDIAA